MGRMPDDYSTPNSPESVPEDAPLGASLKGAGEAEAAWVPGDLPAAPAAGADSPPPDAQPDEAAEADPEAPEPAASPKRRKARRPAASRDSVPPLAQTPNGSLSLDALLESLLFVAEGPVPVARLAEALEISPREVEAALGRLAEHYQHRGLSLQRFRDRIQLTTSPLAAAAVERFLGLAATTSLSRAALETLAIIAYQQPVTRPHIESVRGVNSDSVIKNLLSKGLIEETGRSEGPGRPVLYATTPEFLQHFGLTTLAELPPLNLDAPAEPEAAEPPGEDQPISDLLKG